MRCPRTLPVEKFETCSECNGAGETVSKTNKKVRYACSRCPGRSGIVRRVVPAKHPEQCALCDATETLRADLAEWVSERTLATMTREEQRAIIKLHNAKQLVQPPSVRSAQSIVFVVKNTKRAHELVHKLLPEAECLHDDDYRFSKERRYSIKATGPSVEQMIERLRELRAEARHAAA